MSPNVLVALTDLWGCASNTNNRRTLTPWVYYECPSSYRVYEVGSSDPVYLLDEVKRLDDGTPIFEGRILDWHGTTPESREKVYTAGTPEAFFKLVDAHITRTSFRVQLTVAEHRELLQYLRDTFPNEVFDSPAMLPCWNLYAARPFVGRTLCSLSAAEAACLPDNLALYCLRNEQGRWWKTLRGDEPVTLAALQADSYEGNKRITGFRVPAVEKSSNRR
jgi:hypothetical protein